MIFQSSRSLILSKTPQSNKRKDLRSRSRSKPHTEGNFHEDHAKDSRSTFQSNFTSTFRYYRGTYLGDIKDTMSSYLMTSDYKELIVNVECGPNTESPFIWLGVFLITWSILLQRGNFEFELGCMNVRLFKSMTQLNFYTQL